MPSWATPRSPTRRSRGAAALLLLLVVVALGSGGHGVAHAQGGGAERIVSYLVAIDVRPDGALEIEETIEYDFGSAVGKHGIYRTIPVRFRYEPDPDFDRVYRITSIDVEAAEGTPDDLEVTEAGNSKALRIGHPDVTIRGRHTYRIRYVVHGALNAFEDHDELYWNAVGNEWSVPIESVSVRVSVPGPIGRVACFAGPRGSSLPCGTAAQPDPNQAVFSHGAQLPGGGVTVVVGFPKGVVEEPQPILDERFSLVRAFAVTPATAAGAGAVALLSLFGVGHLLWRTGRDRRAAVTGDVGRRRLGEDAGGPVAYRPPEGCRPAHVGVLVDERAHPVDVTATIVDLAVRGHLTVEEIPKRGWFGKADWKLAATGARRDDLEAYERRLYEGLFDGRTEVTLSELKDTFASDLKAVQGMLYEDCVKRGWFARRPDRVRGVYLAIGIGALVLSVGLVVLLAAFTHAALVGVPLVLAAAVLAFGHRWAPARTPKGSTALRDALGFREFVTSAEAGRMQFAEQENIFATYLPYAIVFGVTEKWARAFAGLDGAPPPNGLGWYRPYGTWSTFDSAHFADSMDSFAVQTSGTIVSTPSSSGSSGFGGGSSGGGGGGGGGGSW